jgi:hypothetical protein
MNVSELVKLLQTCPQNARVEFLNENTDENGTTISMSIPAVNLKTSGVILSSGKHLLTVEKTLDNILENSTSIQIAPENTVFVRA